ncbi:nitroreductase [Candidatus Epulonipiscium fishelsonii]|uniref:Nitroreductase n=1 Tax=Candidatus Epulonipiscium fishelsonii TaxID=77094 RepID=A0ACC8X752_9FIRM|nr:nitroreductase [Epulopiscium sp. SCG-B11WGA-EpuloA1]ONI42676.1 nitroreductase [Epulopiscium sp. SCG-B05WGA-EpuloA1]
MNSIFTRRSVRDFLEKEVEAEKIEKLLKAGMQAPSAANQQPWEFLVVKGKENLEKLSQAHMYSGPLKNANINVVVLGNTERMRAPDYWQQDLGACTQNILLEAVELGLGTLWCGIAPKEDRVEFIQSLYGLDPNLVPFCVIAVGYPKNEDDNKFLDRYDPARISYIN